MNSRILPSLTLALASILPAPALEPDRFVKSTVVSGCEDPMQLDFTSDGTLFWIERRGAVKWRRPDGSSGLSGTIPSFSSADAGALAIVTGRQWPAQRDIFVFYCPEALPRVLKVERLSLAPDLSFLPDSSRVLLTIPLEVGIDPSHCGGGLAWDGHGNLLIGTGDNSPPQDTPAVHPTERNRDSRRSAANPHDLRGKILRIHPEPDGSFSIPTGNLFTNPKDGRPEVFAFGVRNPFRLSCDPKTGWITWGDVGGNVKTDLDLGPEGFDEINLTREPGFFGWPFCSGPNLPWRPFDGKSLKPSGPFWDPAKLVNDSPTLPAPIALPPSRPALLWYGSEPSQDWPFLGSGGRSITGGIIFRRPANPAPDALPAELDGTLIFAEWMRNWLCLARLNENGTLLSAEPFTPNLRFRKPAALATGPDGALYIAEMGERWTGNKDSSITRIAYLSGNRPPVAVVSAPVTSGPCPLTINPVSAPSSDPDRDSLAFSWDWQGAGLSGHADGPSPSFTFTQPGIYTLTLTARDPSGALSKSSLSIAAGNAAPTVSFSNPPDGSFYDWSKPVPWSVNATDTEDGNSITDRLLVTAERRDRFPDAAALPPGLALMRATTCFSCHQTADKSAGPPYAEVARRYAADPAARPTLATRIISGGKGVWGDLPMPPHPQHSPAEAALMIDWILSLAQQGETLTARGASGEFKLAEPSRQWGTAQNGVLRLHVAATDLGANGLASQLGASEITLRSRRQRACFFDHGHLAASQDNLDQGGMVARLEPDGWIRFRHLRYQDFSSIQLHGWVHGGDATLSIHKDSPDSPPLVSTTVKAGPATGKAAVWNLAMPNVNVHGAPADVIIALKAPKGTIADFMFVEFAR